MKTFLKTFTINAHSLAIAVLIFILGFSSCKKVESADTNGLNSYSSSFVKAADAIATSVSGTATSSFNPSTLELSYRLTWSGLGSNATGVHFHDEGRVIIHIEGFEKSISGTISGTATLTASQANDLEAGKIYAQIHTVNIPAGEIEATL
jgi:hypothetical protein